MTETLAIWLIIAKSPTPITADEIRAQWRGKTAPQSLRAMAGSGKVKRQNIAGIAHYTAIKAPGGLTMQDILDIAKVRVDGG